MVFIYILKLQKNKYYVGKTETPYFRIQKHFDGGGSAWTRKYPPVEIEEVITDCDDYDEDKYTKMYMDQYGIDNVRGGSYSSVFLDNTVVNLLEKQSDSTNDRCFKCGKRGHFANQCDESESEEEEEELTCFRCGRIGHCVSSCYARTHIRGYYLKK